MLALETAGLLNQDAETGITTLVDTRNGFNELIRLEMIWTVLHRRPTWARFTFNCYMDWTQLLLCQPGDVPVILLSQEGVTQGNPLTMVLYGITLVPLAEELIDEDPKLL